MHPNGPSYLWHTFRYLSISISFAILPPPTTPISCNVPPLSQLNVGPIAKRAPMFQCFNRFVAHHLLANSSCLPGPLFLNHIWICSQIIVGFVPRPSAHLFPISCGLVSNWEGGFAEQESTIFVAPSSSIFLQRQGLRAPCSMGARHRCRGGGVARWLPDPFTGCAYTCNLCQPNARSIRNLCIHVERERKKEQLFQILGPIVSITATMRGSRTPNKLLLMAKAESIPLLLTTLWEAVNRWSFTEQQLKVVDI